MTAACTEKHEIVRLMKKGLPALGRDDWCKWNEIYHTIVSEIIEGLLNGHRIEIRDFGVLYTQECKGYLGRNPKTGKEVPIPPKRKARFKVGRNLIRLVDESKGAV